MKQRMSAVMESVHLLALSVWLGGIVMIGAVVAPAVVGELGRLMLPLGAPHPAPVVGIVVGAALRRFGPLVAGCGMVMLAAQVTQLRGKAAARAERFRLLFTLVALAGAEFCRRFILPSMDAAKTVGNQPLFDRWHHIYSGIAMGQVWLLVAVAVATGILSTIPRVATEAPRQ